MSLLPPRGQRLLPVFSGVLLALAFPPLHLVVPAFVGLVPFLVFLADQPPGPAGRWNAVRGGMLLGLVFFGLQLYWLSVALIVYSKLAIAAYIGAVLVVTMWTTLMGWAMHYTRERLGLSVAVLAVLFWPAAEWAQGHMGDLSFPWLGLGSALSGFPTLAGAADLVGARGLSVWLAAVNGLLAAGYLRFRVGRSPARLLAGALALAVAPPVYGVVRAATLELEPVARVAVVQPNITQDLKMDRQIALDTSISALVNLTGSLAGEDLDLVVWPEVAVPVDLMRSDAVQDVIYTLSLDLGAPILAGSYGVDRGERVVAYNSAFLVDGLRVVSPRYDKRQLVPFVERVPFVDPEWLEGITGDLEWFGGLGRGRVSPAYPVDDVGYGPLICYESIFAPLSRRYRNQGGDILVNLTNDAWYGREEWWGRTTALWQHPAHMVMRAIENRMGVARAANTGISMFIDPLGRVYNRTSLFTADVRVDTVYTTEGRTLYTRWGDWLATLATLLAVGVVVWARSRARAAGDGGHDGPGGH